MIENERTGEQVEIVVDTPELLRMEVTWMQPGTRTLRHLHPGMEERWEVIDGRAAFEVDGVIVEAGPGAWVIAPKGRPHLAWNPTYGPVRLSIEMRPALRWADFVRRLFAGDDPGQLLEEHCEEIVLAPLERLRLRVRLTVMTPEEGGRRHPIHPKYRVPWRSARKPEWNDAMVLLDEPLAPGGSEDAWLVTVLTECWMGRVAAGDLLEASEGGDRVVAVAEVLEVVGP